MELRLRLCKPLLSNHIARKVAGALFISFIFLFVFFFNLKSMNTNGHREKNTFGGRRSFGWVVNIFTRHASFQRQLQPCSIAVVSLLPAGPGFQGFIFENSEIAEEMLVADREANYKDADGNGGGNARLKDFFCVL